MIARRLLIAGPLAALLPSAAWAQPAADLWSRWTRHDAGATTTVDHAAWTRFLGIYARPGADRVVRLPYGAIAPADRAALATYMSMLQAVPVSALSRAEQLAYWINLYNALTVQVVVDRYPVKSIRDISLGGSLAATFAGGPWDAKLVRIEGEAVSLNDVEHRILRPIWRDPRIHYAVNCASLGCPPLRSVAFTAANTGALMDEAARAFVNGQHGVRRRGGDIFVSSIYKWFRSDFGTDDRAVLDHIARFAEPELAQALREARRIAGDYYDWALNDAT